MWTDRYKDFYEIGMDVVLNPIDYSRYKKLLINEDR